MQKIYTAGHCLTRGSQLQRMIEKSELAKANPDAQFYVPQENKAINDKTKLKDDTGLAEKIVRHDTDAILWSNTVVIEPLPEACGTMVELGQLLGMKDVAEQVIRIIEDEEISDGHKIELIFSEMIEHRNRKVYPHYEDVRRVDGISEKEDRRSLGINQYVYGACLKLTDGKGFYKWDEILEEVKQ